jgi:ABC-type Fe3+/spermidine/putrescine transport system ATPase subunit
MRVGRPQGEAFQHPRDVRVAEHAGASNVFQGTVVGEAGSATGIVWHGERLAVSASLPASGTIAQFCVRPEEVRLVWPERAAERQNVFRGWLTNEVKRGIDSQLRFRAEGPAAEAGEIEIHR